MRNAMYYVSCISIIFDMQSPSWYFMILLYQFYIIWHDIGAWNMVTFGSVCVYGMSVRVHVGMWCVCMFVLLQSFACPVCMDMHEPFALVMWMQEPMCDHYVFRYIGMWWSVLVCNVCIAFEIVQCMLHQHWAVRSMGSPKSHMKPHLFCMYYSSFYLLPDGNRSAKW